MNVQATQDAAALDVSIDIHREAGGFLSARVYRLDGTLIVITPPCDTQDGAVSIARGMYLHRKLAIPTSFTTFGTA